MRKLFTFFGACLVPAWLLAQTPAPAKPAPATPAQSKPAQPAEPAKTAVVVTPGLAEAAAPPEITKLVQSWLDAWNKLDGTDAATQKFLDLYAPDAKHEVGVPGRPLGPEFFEAPNGIRRMAEDFARLNTEAAYRLETFTAAEKGFDLIYYTEGPWGGPAVAVPYTGAYTVKDSKRRFFYPGVAVFHVKDGKITYARFYQDRDDISEVRP
jgi:ketosteroid isomerase-like protein